MRRIKSTNKRNVLFVLFCVFLILFIAIFLLPGYLYKEQITDADILVIEGWLPAYALEEGICRFNKGNYSLLVTTGTQMPAEFRMGSQGSLIFDLSNFKLSHKNHKISSVKVNARGTKADRQFPYFNLLLNDSLIGGNYVTQRNSEYEFPADMYPDQIKVIKINFINDTYTRWKDRNLYISSVEFGDITIPAHSRYVFYDIKNREYFEEYEPGFTDYANYSAFTLKRLGFKDSMVILPASDKKFSRTYSCALAFKHWYLNSPFKGEPVNILSLGPHTRRTWMIYKKVLGRDTDLGIILIDSQKYNRKNWYRSLVGARSIINEMVNYISTAIILPFANKDSSD
jgi:hypothetical protein